MGDGFRVAFLNECQRPYALARDLCEISCIHWVRAHLPYDCGGAFGVVLHELERVAGTTNNGQYGGAARPLITHWPLLHSVRGRPRLRGRNDVVQRNAEYCQAAHEL